MKFYIIAGEASGDLHGSNLMKGLYVQDPGADIRFWGGPLMDGVFRQNQQGTGLVKDYREGAVMGFWEVLMKGFTVLANLRQCKADILAWKPDAVILIDYPGFNFRVAEFAHRMGFKVYYYIAPKVWASREGRIRKIKAWVDRLFIVFPFEQEYFRSKGVPFTYVGNPLLDAIDQSPALQEPREAFCRRCCQGDEAPYIALLAGSRKMEIDSMMPVFMAFADNWHTLHPECRFVVAAAPSRSLEDYAPYLGERPYVSVLFGETYGVLRHARAAVINSGTASLEAALIGTPQMVAYRMAALTAFIARRIIKVPYVSLANLILGRLAFKEFLQEDFTLGNLVQEMQRLWEDGPYRQAMTADYSRVRELLGGSGASLAVAKALIEEINTNKK